MAYGRRGFTPMTQDQLDAYRFALDREFERAKLVKMHAIRMRSLEAKTHESPVDMDMATTLARASADQFALLSGYERDDVRVIRYEHRMFLQMVLP